MLSAWPAIHEGITVATIRKRTRADGKTSYQAIIRLHGHSPTSASFPNKTAAKKWAQRTELEIRENRYFKHSEASKHTMSELIEVAVLASHFRHI